MKSNRREPVPPLRARQVVLVAQGPDPAQQEQAGLLARRARARRVLERALLEPALAQQVPPPPPARR